MPDGRDQGSILAQISAQAPDLAYPRVTQAAQAVVDARERAFALAGLIAEAPEDQRQGLMVSIADAVQAMVANGEDAVWIDLVVSRVLAYAPAANMLEMIESLSDDAAKRIGVVRAARRLPSGTFERVLAVARSITSDSYRAEALSALAAVAEPGIKTGLLEEVFDAALSASTDIHHDNLLAPGVLALLELPADRLPSICQRAMAKLSILPRPDAVAKLRSLTPLLERVGGEKLLRDAAAALTLVARWFP
jgi:hypothetical protein